MKKKQEEENSKAERHAKFILPKLSKLKRLNREAQKKNEKKTDKGP